MSFGGIAVVSISYIMFQSEKLRERDFYYFTFTRAAKRFILLVSVLIRAQNTVYLYFRQSLNFSTRRKRGWTWENASQTGGER